MKMNLILDGNNKTSIEKQNLHSSNNFFLHK